MELQQLHYFKIVAETEKISDAAERLFISSPALSSSISRLEKDLGYRLFDRTGNKIQLNPSGQIFLKHVNDIFQSIQTAKEELRQNAQNAHHHIGVACINTTNWVDLVAAFSQTHPDMILSCTQFKPEDLTVSCLFANHDFLLCSEEEIPEPLCASLESLTLFEDDILVAVSPQHPLARKKQVSVLDLASEKLLLPMPSYPFFRNLSRLFQACDIPLPANNAYSYLMAIRLAAQGSGITFSSSHMKSIVDMPLVFLPVSDPHSHWTCQLYWQREKQFTPEQAAFQNFARQFYSRG